MAWFGRKNRSDDALALAIASGTTARQAALTCGLSERTVHRRLADPAFQARVKELRRELVERATRMLTALSVGAVGTLHRLIAPEVPPSIQLGAARTILEMDARFRETEEIEERLTALEARLGGREKR